MAIILRHFIQSVDFGAIYVKLTEVMDPQCLRQKSSLKILVFGIMYIIVY